MYFYAPHGNTNYLETPSVSPLKSSNYLNWNIHPLETTIQSKLKLFRFDKMEVNYFESIMFYI